LGKTTERVGKVGYKREKQPDWEETEEAATDWKICMFGHVEIFLGVACGTEFRVAFFFSHSI